MSSSDLSSECLFSDLYIRQILLWAREDNKLTGKNVTIAVIDTGIIQNAEELRGCIVNIPGVDRSVFNTTNEPDHYVGTHGTEVAILIHLIAPDAKIYDIKAGCAASGAQEMYLLPAVARCIDDIKPDIINISMGVHRPCNGSCKLDDIVNLAVDHNIPVVAAAGNRGKGGPIACPGNARGAITVGGAEKIRTESGHKIQISEISSWSYASGKPDIVAPSDIPVRTRYLYKLPHSVELTVDDTHRGTSYAAPFVTGALALLLQKKDESKDPINFIRNAQTALLASADKIDAPVEAQGNCLINFPRAARTLGVV